MVTQESVYCIPGKEKKKNLTSEEKRKKDRRIPKEEVTLNF